MSLLIFLWALVNLVEMNNTITYAVYAAASRRRLAVCTQSHTESDP